jgi:cysteine desulfurase/selenocysteine lyase
MTIKVKSGLDVERIREAFPILARETRSGKRVVYLDSAATSQKPLAVINAMSEYYKTQNANIHRGIHQLAEEATRSYESARERIATFIGAGSAREIIFTRNATEAINLVAYSWGRSNLESGDLILLTEMEHHSNLVPWQILAAERGVQLEFVPVTEEGLLDIGAYRSLLARGPKLVGFVHMSNVLGTINPLQEMTDLAHQAGALVIVDAAQSVPHLPVDVSKAEVDFFAFSGHKMLGPTGIGVLYAREALLEAMPPFLGGGDMIKRVHLHEFKTNRIPFKFEAGTPAIAEGIGLGAAVEFLEQQGLEKVHAYEQELTAYAIERMEEVPGVRVYGPAAEHLL